MFIFVPLNQAHPNACISFHGQRLTTRRTIRIFVGPRVVKLMMGFVKIHICTLNLNCIMPQWIVHKLSALGPEAQISKLDINQAIYQICINPIIKYHCYLFKIEGSDYYCHSCFRFITLVPCGDFARLYAFCTRYN